MSSLDLKIENARAIARGLHCEGVIIIAVDKVADGKQPFWYGKAVSYGSDESKCKRMGAFMDWLLDRTVQYACPKCKLELEPITDIIKTDPPAALCRGCGFGGFLRKFDITDY